MSQRSISSLYEERGHGQLRVFDYEELQGATAEFSRAQKLGEGGFGSVYKGFIRAADGKGDRVPVAVKKLNQRGMQVRPYVCSAYMIHYSLLLLPSLWPISEGVHMPSVTRLSTTVCYPLFLKRNCLLCFP
jgi:hypothetical protein